MADELDPNPGPDEIDEEVDLLDPEADDDPDGTAADTETPEDDDEDDSSSDEGDGGRDGDRAADQRGPRGVPDARQRDARRNRESRLQDQLDRQARELDELKRRNTGESDGERRQRQRQEEENARLQGPEAYADYKLDQAKQENRQFLGQLMRRTDDASDSSKFDRLASRNQVYASVADEVETEHQRIMASNPGYVPNREALAQIIIGRRAVERGGRAATRQRTRAAEGVRREAVRAPSNGASTVSQPRRRQAKDFGELSIEEMEAQLNGIPVRSR
jgi:hypothetical protein